MISRPATVAACLALLWFVLSEGDTASWTVGVPAVAVGAALSCLLPRPSPWRVTPAGALGFSVYFVRHAFRGAWDVAMRALGPGRHVEPGFVDYDVRLPPGPARTFFLNAITLLPGTLTANLVSELARVHVIDTRQPNHADLALLETRVARLFGCSAALS